MPVAKQTYTVAAPLTASNMAAAMRSALIDAGLMTEWFDSFLVAANTTEFRVLRITHDAAKTYGSSFYCFAFRATEPPTIGLASGWNASTDLPTGTQFVDFHVPPSTTASVGLSIMVGGTQMSMTPTNTLNTLSDAFLHRYTSGNQSWFLWQQGSSRSQPFAILHGSTALHPWLDLDKGVISGLTRVSTSVSNHSGTVQFRVEENIRRALLYGHSLRGDTQVDVSFGGDRTRWHDNNYTTHSYMGIGSVSNANSNNRGVYSGGGHVVLPVGRSSSNPAFAADYIPICTGVQWSPFTSTPLSSDFAVYMHYADNSINLFDRFVVTAGVEEWEVLSVANNATATHGASPVFLARVV